MVEKHRFYEKMTFRNAPGLKILMSLMIIITLILCVNIVSANEKTFIPNKDYQATKSIESGKVSTTNYGKYEITESKWWDVFGWFTDEPLIDVELKDNTDDCYQYCSATKEITIYKDTSLIDDVRFYTIEGEKRILQDIRRYNFYIKTNEEEKEIDDYEQQCKETGKTTSNGTKELSCEYVKIGSHIVKTPLWIPYTLGEIKKAGTYEVKLEGEKKPSRTVDWQVKTNGEWLDDWAVWGGSMVYDEIEGTTINQTLWYNYTTTISGGPTFTTTQTGGYLEVAISSGEVASGTNRITSINLQNNSGINNMSMRIVLTCSDSSTGSNEASFTVFGTKIYSIISPGYIGGYGVSDDSVWTFRRNYSVSNKFDVYNDGVWNQSIIASDTNITIYASSSASRSANVKIYYVYYFTPAYITLNSPLDSYISTTNLINFNATATISGGATLENMSLWHNGTGTWARNQTILAVEQTQQNITSNFAQTGEESIRFGFRILVDSGNDLTLFGVIRPDGATPTKAYLSNDADVTLATATFSGNIATFSTAQTLTAGTYYKIQTDADGSSYTTKYENSGTLPQDLLGFNVTNGLTNNGLTTTFSGVKGFVIGNTTSTLNYVFTETIISPIKWGIEACDSDGDCGWSENRTLYIDTTKPLITIHYPESVYNILPLNVTITDTNLNNSVYYFTPRYNINTSTTTGYINFSSNSFVSGTGTGDLAFEPIIFGGNYNSIKRTKTTSSWTATSNYPINCSSATYNNLSDVWDANDFICVNKSGELISLQFLTDNDPRTLPITVRWDYYNYTNLTNINATAGIPKVTNVNMLTKKNITIFAKDNAGNVNFTDFNWSNVLLFVNNITYVQSVYETSDETFVLNLTYSPDSYSGISTNLIYNGTSYITTKTGSGDTLLFTKNNLTIPIVSISGTNLSFYWSIALTNSTGTFYYNTTSINQTVSKGTSIYVNTTCPVGTSPAFNFTSYYEQNLSNVNMSTVNYYITYGLSTNSSVYSINNTLSNVNRFLICLNNSQSYYNVGYGEIQYSVTDSVNRRYYIFGGTRLTNTTVSVPLYALETTSATQFLITAQSPELIPYTNHYVALLRWYPQTNSYKVVDMGKTDDKGQTILNVKVEDVDYRIAVYDSNGNLIELFNSIRMICQTTPCTYSLFIEPNPLDLSRFTNIESGLTYDTVTKEFTFIWNDPTQLSQFMNLTVYKMGSLSDDIICSNSATGYTGVLVCSIGTSTGKIKAEIYRTASEPTLFKQLYIDVGQFFTDISGGKEVGLFIGVILLIFFALIGTISPIMVVILAVISLIPLYLLGNISWQILMGIGVVGGIILHFLRRTQ